MRYIKIHIEGGPDRGGKMKAQAMRAGFSAFFKELRDAADVKGVVVVPVLHGSRGQAFKQFCFALRAEPENHHVLLVDSEMPIKPNSPAWPHVKAREGDGWDCPPGADEANLHFMAQAVEAWFFADVDALEKFYGQGFQRNSLSKRKNVEEIPKAEHLPQLEAATRGTSKGRYHKIDHPPKLLETVSPVIVRSRAPHCDHLFLTSFVLIEKV